MEIFAITLLAVLCFKAAVAGSIKSGQYAAHAELIFQIMDFNKAGQLGSAGEQTLKTLVSQLVGHTKNDGTVNWIYGAVSPHFRGKECRVPGMLASGMELQVYKRPDVYHVFLLIVFAVIDNFQRSYYNLIARPQIEIFINGLQATDSWTLAAKNKFIAQIADSLNTWGPNDLIGPDDLSGLNPDLFTGAIPCV